jgi:hypothetical protein
MGYRESLRSQPRQTRGRECPGQGVTRSRQTCAVWQGGRNSSPAGGSPSPNGTPVATPAASRPMESLLGWWQALLDDRRSSVVFEGEVGCRNNHSRPAERFRLCAAGRPGSPPKPGASNMRRHVHASAAAMGPLWVWAASCLHPANRRALRTPRCDSSLSCRSSGGLDGAASETVRRLRLEVGPECRARPVEIGLDSQAFLGGSPLLADGPSATLADIKPPRRVDLLEVELEKRVTRDGLDHSSYAARHHHGADYGPGRRVACHLRRGRANAEFVILRAGQRVDHAPPVPAEVPAFRRRARDRSEEPAACQDRAEWMQARASVTSHGRDVADGEARHARWHCGAALQGSHSGPQPRGDLG